MEAKVDVTLRKTYRGQLTKLCNNVNELIGSDAEIDNIAVLCERIKSLRVTLNELNAKLIPTFTDENFESECEKIAEYDSSAVEAVARLEVCIMKRKTERCQEWRPEITEDDGNDGVRTSLERGLENPQNVGNFTQNIQQKTVRLPKLDLIKFDGNLEMWPAFWEQFSQAIHNNTELDENCKFSYLKNQLVGKAALSVSGLTTSHSSYNDAIELLKLEYGQSERIVDCYIQKLYAVSPLKYDKDASGLRKLYNTVSSITRSLETLGVSTDQYSLMVKSMIFKVLPYNLRVQFNKYKLSVIQSETSSSSRGSIAGSVNGDTDYKKQITDLLDFIKIEVDSLEQAQSVPNDHTSKPSENRFKNAKKRGDCHDNFTAQGLLALSNENCLFCNNKNHITKNCRADSITLAEKKTILKNNSRCFRCTFPNHRSKFCKTKDIVCAKCKGRHVTALCDPSYKPNVNASGSNSGQSSQTALTNFASSLVDCVYLQTACVYLKSETDNNDYFVRAIIDGGSQLTFIKQCVSRELNLPIVGTHKISVCSFGSSQQGIAKLCNRVEISLKGQFSNKVIKIHAIEAPEICFDSVKPPLESDPIIKSFAISNQLADVGVDQLTKKGISLLIGADNYWSIVKNQTQFLTSKLTAINTEFGWTIHGIGKFNETSNFSVNFNVANILHVQITENDVERDEPNLKLFWDLETIGINAEMKTLDNFTENFIENNISLKDNRYEVSLPWQTDKALDSNYAGALIRVKNLTHKLCRDNKIVEYDRAMREYFISGCAEIVNEVDIKRDESYYMPHRPVYRLDKKTSRVRVVFDASAHGAGMSSLNDKLVTGQNLVPDLIKILLNFRVGCIGLTADIEKAFLQISLNIEDRDYHRFLWFSNPISEEMTSVSQLPKLETFRMCRVTFGVTTSPFLLATTLRKHLLSQPDKEFGQKLHDSFYVDDFIIAVNSTEDAIDIYERSKEIMSKASMNLRKWCSNEPDLQDRFFNDTNEQNNDEPKKVLGINWYSVTDQLVVDLNPILNNSANEFTKRFILKTVARIFDPLGILGPFTIRVKVLLQTTWKLNIQWDEILPNDIMKEWMNWLRDVPDLKDYSIPRCLIGNKNDLVELHVFADASPQAYGAVAYLKCLSNNKCGFLIAKNRVAPLKQTLTLPKLELMASLCAARLQRYILENVSLKITDVFLWSDSKITLYWIKGRPTRWKPFIQNRINEIRLNKNVTWRYCPGKENPADLLSRGVPSAKLLKEHNLWQYGPSWLPLERSNWPSDEKLEEETIDSSILSCLVEVEQKKESDPQPIFSLERYSSYEKHLRITALVYRFINNVTKERIKKTGKLTTDELLTAKLYWIKYVQGKEYFEEISRLKEGKEILKHSSILKLTPFLDEDGVLRLGGRLQEADLTYDEKHPVILPKRSNLSIKIIWQSHEGSMHSGTNLTLAIVRKRYWIIRGRQLIKSTISKCIKCKRLKGRAGTEPFAPLPRHRIVMAHPFSVSGIDFAGPLYVKSDSERKLKVYIMLFTCAVTRAVHLELLENLSSESCVSGLRRFIARRGVPEIIYSDNAKTFKRTDRELEELTSILRNDKIQDLASHKRIRWKFIVERGAWWGGFWERMVRTVKGCLKLTLGRALITYNELQTIITEVEATVNSRPLTYIDDDPTSLFILSPSKFLIGPQDIGLALDLKFPAIKRNEILMIWKTREALLSKFWKIWQADYLQQLRSFHQRDNVTSNSIKVGDIVIIHDKDKPRLMWKLARVIQIFQGRDGRTRACELVTGNGGKFRRPVQLLYPLEVPDILPGEDVVNKSDEVNVFNANVNTSSKNVPISIDGGYESPTSVAT